VMATESRLARGISRSTIFLQALRRACILYVLGLFLHAFPFFNFATMRYYGVLHRIAFCYLIAVILLLIDQGWKSKVALVIAALVGYWAIMRFVPVPGYGVPTHDIPLLDPDRNLTAWIDRSLFSAPHLYEHTRDPEGLLSTLPAMGTILIGTLTGMWIRSSRTLMQKMRGILSAGACLTVAGLLWNLSFPINKKLWTSSFVLFSAGLTLLLLGLAIWLVDTRKADEKDTDRDRHPRLLLPFFVFGVNSIAAYAFAELFSGVLHSIHVRPNLNVAVWIFNGIHAVIGSAAVASLVYSLLFVIVSWLPIYLLYRKRIMLKV
jgi:predicted acyltransferase